ncbi:hypothetical protein BaRGS_00020771 [Batillaria attramentaria]|uniref:Uncharacterized protein n=1 Tax=Batillaria attramentaria TaxID=370345 RepID=A0ABD0KLS5_9CAEN
MRATSDVLATRQLWSAAQQGHAGPVLYSAPRLIIGSRLRINVSPLLGMVVRRQCRYGDRVLACPIMGSSCWFREKGGRKAVEHVPITEIPRTIWNKAVTV